VVAPQRADIDRRGARQAPQPARLLDGGDRRRGAEALCLVRRVVGAFAVDARRLEGRYDTLSANVMLVPLALPTGSYLR
jgi:hypothetical protein